MRLIDADRLLDKLRGNILIDVTPKLEDAIAQQPTAFDKEKVILELRNMKDVPHDDSVEEIVSTGIWNKSIQKAIEIVEKSGIK